MSERAFTKMSMNPNKLNINIKHPEDTPGSQQCQEACAQKYMQQKVRVIDRIHFVKLTIREFPGQHLKRK